MSSKEKLIVAMQELLWEQGYEATSPRDILKRANVGQGVLYHHFRGKLDLATTALERTIDEMILELDHLVSVEKPPMGRVWDYLTHARTPLKGCRAGRMLMEPGIDQSPLIEPVRRYFSTLRDRLADALEEAQRQGEIQASINRVDLSATLVATVQGGYLLSRASGEDEGMDSAIRGALALMEGATAPR